MFRHSRRPSTLRVPSLLRLRLLSLRAPLLLPRVPAWLAVCVCGPYTSAVDPPPLPLLPLPASAPVSLLPQGAAAPTAGAAAATARAAAAWA